MTRFAAALEKPARKVLPRSLLGRSLLIILVPLLVVQAVALLIFYGSHLNLISRRLSNAVAGEIAQSISLLQSTNDATDRAWILGLAQRDYELRMTIRPGAHLPPPSHINILGPMDDDLAIGMRQIVGLPFRMDWQSDATDVLIDVQLPDSVLHVAAPRKRLYTSMIYVYVLWLSGSSILLFGIAALFMRNQVRAIRRLAEAAENFGLGRDTGAIRPRAPSKCARRPRRSTGCRSAYGVSFPSARKCSPASATICARRSPGFAWLWRCCRARVRWRWKRPR